MNSGQNVNPKIVLVSIHTALSPQSLPLAAAFLKSAAINIPVDITLIDFFAGQSPDECALAIKKAEPDAVGFSMYLWNREMCVKISEQLRLSLPSAKLFAGGPEVTADPGAVLRTAAFDFIVSGEGESPFRQLCHRMAAKLELEGISGLQSREDKLTSTPAPEISDLDEIPSPYISGVLDSRNYTGILWQLSRGCCFTCDFCFDSRGSRGVRRFSLKRLEAELHHFVSAGVSQVFVLDSTFNQDSNRAKAILRMIRKIAPGMHFHFEVRSEFIDREMSRLFAKLACSIQIGLQSSDTRVMKEVGRIFRRDDFVSRIGLLNESGAVFGFDLIYGLPGDTLQGFYNSLDFALTLYPNHLDIFPLAILPGTALHLKSSALALKHLAAPPYTLISSPVCGIDDMQRARQTASACDIFYTRGKAVAWFNAVMAVLKVKPSEFLQRFGETLAIQRGAAFSESDFDDGEVWKIQRGYLSQIFSGSRLKRFLPLVLDLVDYHYHYAAALLAPQTELLNSLTDKKGILAAPLRRSDSLRLVRFNYEILAIVEAGAPDIRWMSEHLKQQGSFAAIYPHGNVVCTESFDEAYYRLLELLDGRTNAGDLAAKAGINRKGAAEFLLFALKEGFVIYKPD